MSNITKKFEKYILKVCDELLPKKRKSKYTRQYYLKCFLCVLNSVKSWDKLTQLKIYKGKKNDFHWKSIANEFRRWSNEKVFEIAYNNFLSENYKINVEAVTNLYIDVTKFSNAGGSENVSVNVEYRKKNVTSISFICDSNKIPLAIVPVKINSTKNDKNYSSSDVSMVQDNLDAIPNEVKTQLIKSKIHLMGDKGYITQKEFKINDKNIKIITPKRKNQKTKNTDEENELLKDRSTIENLFCDIKKQNRLSMRLDGYINNFMSFIYLSVFNHIIPHF